MEKLRQDIRANQFERVYLLYGEERYLVQMYKNQLKKAIIGDDTMNLNQYTGKGLPVQEVENAVMTMPFFADRRLVLLEDTGLFKSSDEQWSNLVKTIPDSCHVLFVEQEVDKRSRMYKAVKECGYCAEMTHPSMQQRTQWILKGFGRYGLKITQSALDDVNDTVSVLAASAGYTYIDVASAYKNGAGYLNPDYSTNGMNLHHDYYAFLLNSIAEVAK